MFKKRWGMGLFKKKKDIGIPSMPPAQHQENVKQVDFDNIMGDAPPPSIAGQPVSAPKPPIGMRVPPTQPAKPSAQGVHPGATPHQTQHMHPRVQVEEGFELPDFDEKDIRELDKIKPSKPVSEVKPTTEAEKVSESTKAEPLSAKGKPLSTASKMQKPKEEKKE